MALPATRIGLDVEDLHAAATDGMKQKEGKLMGY
jgi:hypothetical protein